MNGSFKSHFCLPVPNDIQFLYRHTRVGFYFKEIRQLRRKITTQSQHNDPEHGTVVRQGRSPSPVTLGVSWFSRIF